MNSVRIISTKKEAVETALHQYAGELKKRPEIEGVYLAGSWAKGNYGPYSDVDLMIIVKPVAKSPRDRIPEYLPDKFPVSLDLFIYTREELEKNDFAQGLLKTAVQI